MNTLTDRYSKDPIVLDLIDHPAIVTPATVEHHDSLVVVDSEAKQGVSFIHYGVANVENPSGVIIMPVSWSDYAKRPFQEIRMGAIAQFTGMRVVCIDFPGMGDHLSGRGDEFTEHDLEDMKNGRFSHIAARYWEALEADGQLKDAQGVTLPLTFWNNSLSTLTGAEMLSQMPAEYVVDNIVQSEIMALDNELALLFAGRFAIKGKVDLDYYGAMNGAAPKFESGGLDALKDQVFAQKRAHIKPVTTLAKGRHTEAYAEAMSDDRLSRDPEHGTNHLIICAAKGLTKPDSVQAHVSQIEQSGFDRRRKIGELILAGESHGYQDSLPVLLSLMRHLQSSK